MWYLDFCCYLLRQGHQVTQADLIPLDPPASTSGVLELEGDLEEGRERDRETIKKIE